MGWWRRLLGADAPHPADPAFGPQPNAGLGASAGADGAPAGATPDLPYMVQAATRRQRIVVLTREGCHLCDEVECTVSEVANEHDLDFELLDIDDDESTRAVFNLEVPVVIVDGRVIARWRLHRDDLIAAVRGARA